METFFWTYNTRTSQIASPIKYKIRYNILILTYKCINGSSSNLQYLIKEYKPSHSIKLSHNKMFWTIFIFLYQVYLTAIVLFFFFFFFFLQNVSWCLKQIPLYIKNRQTINQFKTCQKTHLFTMAFACFIHMDLFSLHSKIPIPSVTLQHYWSVTASDTPGTWYPLPLGPCRNLATRHLGGNYTVTTCFVINNFHVSCLCSA